MEVKTSRTNMSADLKQFKDELLKRHNRLKTNLLFDAFLPPEVSLPVVHVPPGTVCAITADAIDEGIETRRIVTTATNAPHEAFKVYDSPYVGVKAARLYKWFKGGLTGNLLAVRHPDGRTEGLRPMISRETAVLNGRPCWHDLIADMEEGVQTVAIITNEFQRRLWLQARLGVTGETWSVYLHADGVSRPLTVSLSRLKDQLALCQEVYGLGFSKSSIGSCLFDASMKNVIIEVGYSKTASYEKELSRCRGTPEFGVALAIVQKPPVTEETTCNKTLSNRPSSPTPARLGPLFA